MNWTTVWEVVLIATACAFFPLAVAVMVAGVGDIRHMLHDLLAERDE